MNKKELQAIISGLSLLRDSAVEEMNWYQINYPDGFPDDQVRRMFWREKNNAVYYGGLVGKYLKLVK